MTPTQDQPDRRTRITLAVITGFVAGATRAVADWLLDHLTNGR
ncbi:hypothetical protein [Catellatospora paridis]|nr:hypothetical protein [Catellatospora paridis]